MKHLLLLFSVACVVCEIGATSRAYGHGFAGSRFFPATLSTDDPFIADELSLPTIRTPDDGGTRETDISVDFAKRITPKLVLEIGSTFTSLDPTEGGSANGFGNLELGAKYQLLEAHAFLKQAIPDVGSALAHSPNEIRIQFTEAVESAFSKIQVFDASGKEVDKRDVHRDSSNHKLLKVSLPALGVGTYKVVWRVVSVDTHVTNGSYTFRVAR